ncbi:hypothetical protein H2200_013200 [Cladophialophora chaetospira]|uniref:Uncharacterized protein n=1 Tax=Cladophialophora chaetospira TaxID=386627 RepID=A0AA39CBK2_9EURO|nr:hypothetical protein H2200_013200 [Cladophialophora chaetospira]
MFPAGTFKADRRHVLPPAYNIHWIDGSTTQSPTAMSFLNQICEDCLLAELESAAHHTENKTNTDGIPNTTLENGEGLIWDSEVKIEIEGVVAGSPTNLISPDIHPPAESSSCTDEDEKRIVESHVEITIEPDDHNLFAPDFCSPAFTASRHSHNPQTSPIGTSSPSTQYPIVPQPSPLTCQTENNRRAPSSELSYIDDADDEIEHRMSTYAHKARHTTRGRPLTRSNLHNVQKCDVDAGGIPEDFLGTNNAGQAWPTLRGLRSLSSTFLSGVKSEAVENAQLSPLSQKTTSTSSKPQIKNPFRSIRGRKSSPLLHVAVVADPAPSTEPTVATTVSNLSNTEAQKERSMLPQRSTLKDFALFLMQDSKRPPMTKMQSRSQHSGIFRSATAVWSRRGINDQKECHQDDAETDYMSETAFESDSRVTSLQSEGSVSVKADEAPSLFSMMPNIPKSSTMNTLRALIDDLILELDGQENRATSSSVSKCESILARCQMGDVAEVGQVAMPDVHMQQQLVQKQDCVQNGSQRRPYPPRSTSLKARTKSVYALQLG